MRTITLFEYSPPLEPEDREHLNRLQNHLRRINRITKAPVFDSSWGTIRARNYVGVVSIRNTTVQILPKLYRKEEDLENMVEEATRNLLFMLSFANRFKIKETGLSNLKKERSDLYESIVYLFARNLLETLKKNYRRDYERREEDLNVVKGKIVVSKQIQKSLQNRIHCTFFDLTEDTLMNRILKYICHLLLFRVKNRENWLLLQNILSIYEGVTLTPAKLSDFDRIRLNRLNEDYEPFISLARLFLENMSLELQNSQFKTFSFLFDMNVLFEEFTGEFIRKYKKDILNDTDFYNCNIHLQTKKKWLIEKPTRSFGLRPDIVLSSRGDAKLIIDTKYKILDSTKQYFGVLQDDIYQMFAYAKKYECSDIILLYPWNERVGDFQNKTGILKTYHFDDNTRLHIATINLMRDLRDKKEQNNLKRELRGIFMEIEKQIDR